MGWRNEGGTREEQGRDKEGGTRGREGQEEGRNERKEGHTSFTMTGQTALASPVLLLLVIWWLGASADGIRLTNKPSSN
jgi:hypothetical protein